MPCSSADWVWFHVSSSFSRRRMALRDEDAADIAPARVGVSPRLVVHNTHSGCGGTFCALGVRPSLDTHTHLFFWKVRCHNRAAHKLRQEVRGVLDSPRFKYFQ